MSTNQAAPSEFDFGGRDPNLSKIRVVVHRDERGKIAMLLYCRHDDGMVVGAVQGNVAAFGENPANVVQRVFLSLEFAQKWMERCCRFYLNREDVDFLTESAAVDAPLVTPVGQRGVPPRRM